MDNLAHALIGAAVGRAVGGEQVPRAALVGAVAANAPDWTEVLTGWPWPGALYLTEHRGITHALVGCAVQVIALTLFLGAGLAWRRGGAARVPWAAVFALIAAAVASHPLMDWQGSYGLRPFLPWSDRWYFGDFVAISDPLYWIVPLVGLAWGARRHWRPALGWGALLLPVSLLVLLVPIVAPWLQAAWVAIAAIGIAGWTPHWFGVAGRRRAAAWSLAVVACYGAAQAAASGPVKAATRAAAVERFGARAQWAALTEVGRPFTWEGVWASRDTVAGRDWALPRHLDLPAVQRALETRDGRAMARFARFLVARVDADSAPTVVRLIDARYARSGDEEWGVVRVPIE